MFVLGPKGDADSGGLRMTCGVEEGFADNEVDLLRQVAGKLHARFAHVQFDAQAPCAWNTLNQLLQTASQPPFRISRDKPRRLIYPEDKPRSHSSTPDRPRQCTET